jgi:glycosyltransferase involved in cell wall biosynthesis
MFSPPSNQKILSDLSVVIPTLGGSELNQTLKAILLSSHYPHEIILSLPRSYKSYDLNIQMIPNIKIIFNSKKGQVNQRIAGFKAAQTKFIVQLDGDIIIENQTLITLHKIMSDKNHNIAIAPVLREIKSGLDMFSYLNQVFNEYLPLTNPISPIRKTYNLLLHGSKKFNEGDITAIGSNISVSSNHAVDLVSSKWLAGGLVIHRKSNLILDNYFPFKGKAYSEDLIHSFKLQEIGIKLFVSTACSAYIEVDSGMSIATLKGFNRFIIHKYREIRAKAYFLKITKRRPYFYQFLSYLRLTASLISSIAYKLFRLNKQ